MMDKYNEVEKAYIVIKHWIGPRIERITLSKREIEAFNHLLFQYECHIFAMRNHQNIINS